MLRSIDHIVILIRDLATASADYEKLGFTVTPGGEHVGGATHNALISFADGTYFELIAFKNPDAPSQHRWHTMLARGEGLVDFCLLTDSGLAAEVEAMRGRGLTYQGPNDAGRLRPDGQRIVWRGLTSGREIGTSPLPFAIEDVTPRDLRVPGGPATQHRLPVQRVAGVTVVVRDLVASQREFEALLGTEPRAVSPSVEGAQAGLVFDLGQQWIELVQPTSQDTSGATDIHLRLEQRGEGPYEVVLSGEHVGAPGSGELLPLDQTHGARIRIAR